MTGSNRAVRHFIGGFSAISNLMYVTVFELGYVMKGLNIFYLYFCNMWCESGSPQASL